MTPKTRQEYVNKMFGFDNAADLLDQGMGAFLGAVAQRGQQGRKAGGLSRLNEASAPTAPLVIIDDAARMLDKAHRLGVSPQLHQMLVNYVGVDQLESAYNYALPDVAGKALSTAEQVALQSQNENRLGISPELAGGLSRVMGLGYPALIERLTSQMFWGVAGGQTTGKSEEKQRRSVHPFWGV